MATVITLLQIPVEPEFVTEVVRTQPALEEWMCYQVLFCR
jgi:hypothetical protein